MQTWNIAQLNVEPRKPQVVRSDDDTRAIVINLPAGQALQDHQVHERAYLMVAAGEVELDCSGETASGGPGLLAYFEPGERHAVRARSDARVVLLLAPWPGDGHPSQR